MAYYYAVAHQDENSAWGIYLPDVPGVFSAADEEADLVANAVEALRLYAEDEALPPPRAFEALRADPDVAAELAQRAVLVRVPLVENDSRTIRLNITLDAGIVRAIDAAAAEAGMSRSAFLAEAARSAIEK